MSPKLITSLVAVVIAGFLALQSVFTVQQTEQAIVLQFGQAKRTVLEPGLYFKLPFVQNVLYFDKRLLDLDAQPKEIIAADQERLVVDAFAKFQIIDPLKFFQKVGSETSARIQLLGFLDSNLRAVLGNVVSNQIISGERSNLMQLIEEGVNRQVSTADYGIEIIDVRIRRADLPESISERVFGRMQSERQQEAAQIRAEGEEAARRIRAQAERNRTIILARARESSEITRGEGDAYRTAIFACSFGNDPDFFAFYRSMQAYEKAFQSSDTTMVLSPDSDFFKYFGNSGGFISGVESIPLSQPSRSTDPLCKDGVYDLTNIDFLADSAVAPPPLVLPIEQ